MNLYEINAELAELLARGFEVDEETGEIIEDISGKLESLQMAEQDKLEGLALYIKNLTADVDAIKAEEKTLAERRKPKENKSARLKQYLSDYMFNTELKKFETARVSLSFRKSEIVDVDMTQFMPWAEKYNMYLRVSAPSVDKTELKKALKSGDEIPGAMLMKRENLQIK